ncbi:MAG: Hpt domain-containing protein [Phycisphaeraceae bacterium]|nr:Hpt domain-containing protein [Phycisphaeraceae bacterium]
MDPNNTPTIELDDALVQEFIDEAMDTLSSLDPQFVELEKNPEELTIIETIFRPVHSIKGNSGFFGFGQIKQLAHELETLLDLIRKGKLAVCSDVISVLLSGMDALREMFIRVKQNETEIPEGDTSIEQLITKVKCVAQGNSEEATWQQIQLTLDVLSPLLQDQSDDISMQFAELKSQLHKINPLDKSNDDDAANTANQPLMGYLKTLEANPEDNQTIEKLLETLRVDQEASTVQEIIDQYTDAIETMEVFLNTVGLDELGLSVMEDKIMALPASALAEPEAATQVTEQAAQKEQASTTPTPTQKNLQSPMTSIKPCVLANRVLTISSNLWVT